MQANHKRWGVQAGDDDKVFKNGGKFVKIGEKLVENLSKLIITHPHVMSSCLYIQVPSKVCKKETVPLCTKQEVKKPKEVTFNNL